MRLSLVSRFLKYLWMTFTEGVLRTKHLADGFIYVICVLSLIAHQIIDKIHILIPYFVNEGKETQRC